MLRLCRLFRGVSPFTLFLMDQKNNPALKGCAISKRGQILSKMYKELSMNQKKELKQRAARHPSLPRQSLQQREASTKNAKRKSKSEFSKFVRDNYHRVKKLNYRKRFSALSQLYELSKPIDIEKEVKKTLPKLVGKAKTKVAAKTKGSTAKPKSKTNAKGKISIKAAIASVAKTSKKGPKPSAAKKIKQTAKVLKE